MSLVKIMVDGQDVLNIEAENVIVYRPTQEPKASAVIAIDDLPIDLKPWLLRAADSIPGG